MQSQAQMGLRVILVWHRMCSCVCKIVNVLLECNVWVRSNRQLLFVFQYKMCTYVWRFPPTKNDKVFYIGSVCVKDAMDAPLRSAGLCCSLCSPIGGMHTGFWPLQHNLNSDFSEKLLMFSVLALFLTLLKMITFQWELTFAYLITKTVCNVTDSVDPK